MHRPNPLLYLTIFKTFLFSSPAYAQGGFEARFPDRTIVERSRDVLRIRSEREEALNELLPTKPTFNWQESFFEALKQDIAATSFSRKRIEDLQLNYASGPVPSGLSRVRAPGAGIESGGLRSGRLYSTTRSTRGINPAADYVELEVTTSPRMRTAVATHSSAVLGLARSRRELRRLVKELPTKTLVIRGDPLPKSWERVLIKADKRVVYWDGLSSKKTASEVRWALRRLYMPLDPPKVRLLDALPRSENVEAIKSDLAAMKLSSSEAEEWHKVGVDIKRIAGLTGVQRSEATVENIRAAFQDGGNDLIIFIAHQSQGIIYLPNGQVLNAETLKSFKPTSDRNRVTIVISCNAGEAAGHGSTAELIVRNGTSGLVVAPPAPVSALDAPLILEDLLVKSLKVGDVSTKYGYRHFVTPLNGRGRLWQGQLAAISTSGSTFPFNLVPNSGHGKLEPGWP